MIKIPEILKNQRFIKTREKIPIETDWQNTKNYDINDTEFQNHIKNNNSYGVLCGINNLIVVDLDNLEIQNELLMEHPKIFKNTFIVKSANKKLFHFYFYCDIEPKSFKCLDKEKNTLMDVQGIGKQVIGANSVLSNGNTYEIVNNLDILKINYNELKKILIKYDESYVKETKSNSDNKLINNYNSRVDEIKSIIKISDILKNEGINTKKNPTECPFHSSKGGKCFSFTEELYNCFHCGSKGDIFNLYQEIHKCDFKKAYNDLLILSGLDKKQEKQKEKEEWDDLFIKKFIIYKSKDETLYKIFISDFYITLCPNTILGSSEFRKKFFNETGHLLPSIETTEWVKKINIWMDNVGQIQDNTKEANTESLIVETLVNDLEQFMVVKEPKEATTYGRLLYIKNEPDYIYVYNKILDSMIRKNQFKVTLNKLKVIMDEYVEGNSKVIRVGKKIARFFRFKLDSFENIDIEDLDFGDDINEQNKDI